MFHINLQPVVGQQCQKDVSEKGPLCVPSWYSVAIKLFTIAALSISEPLLVVRKSKSADKSHECQNVSTDKICLLWKDVSYIRAAPCHTLPSIV